jgi:hypothetical protein
MLLINRPRQSLPSLLKVSRMMRTHQVLGPSYAEWNRLFLNSWYRMHQVEHLMVTTLVPISRLLRFSYGVLSLLI